MRFFTILAAAVLVAPISAYAQTEAKRETPPATCEQLASDLGVIEKTAETRIEDTGTGCRLTSFFANFGSTNRYRIGELTLNAPGLFESYAAQAVPAEVDLAISGFQISPDTGSALMAYIIEMQSEPMDIHLAYRWDKDARTVELSDLSVKAGDLGSFRFAARFSNTEIDPTALDDVAAIPGAIDQLVFETDNARFAASIFGPPLISSLPFDQDPRPLVAGFITAANAVIAGLPSANVSADSKAALTRFISAFPKPRGDFSVQLQADPGIAFNDLALSDPAGLSRLLGRIEITASHTDAITAP